jgi:hypothetical protein
MFKQEWSKPIILETKQQNYINTLGMLYPHL